MQLNLLEYIVHCHSQQRRRCECCVLQQWWQLSTADAAAWLSNFGNEYCLDDEEETHASARSICQSRNSELASITSDAECDYVAGLMLVNFLWHHLKIIRSRYWTPVPIDDTHSRRSKLKVTRSHKNIFTEWTRSVTDLWIVRKGAFNFRYFSQITVSTYYFDMDRVYSSTLLTHSPVQMILNDLLRSL